jgi:hypothetical protein
VDRLYQNILAEHLAANRQMAFLSGPRQVGKTTIARAAAGENAYLSWDNQDDRATIVRGPKSVANQLQLQRLRQRLPVLVFDELHKYGKWKTYLKGFFDTYADAARIIVTGSARLDVFKRGGDSLMGRYFPYRMHPLSVAETLSARLTDGEIHPPRRCSKESLEHLLEYGGFPEPFLRADARFARRWRSLRREQLVREDLRDLTRVAEVGHLAVLVEILTRQAGSLANCSSLAREINVAVDTIRRWISILQALYVVFEVRPWFRNVAKSLRKQPKIYLWDWCSVSDEGARFENLVASHLLKAVHGWTDRGLGDYRLHFLRDVVGREVDFLVTRDDQPWFLVEVKTSERQLHAPLAYFQDATKADHAFQLVRNLGPVQKDCFAVRTPIVVPAVSFLSQLV